MMQAASADARGGASPEGQDPPPPAVPTLRRDMLTRLTDRTLLLRIGKLTLRIGLLVGVIALVWHELAAIDLRTARDQVESAHLPLVALAVVVVGLAFAGMGLYDVFAFRSTRHLLPGNRWRLGMLFFAWTNFLTLGPIGGPAVRLYFYRHRGLATPEIARGLVRLYSGGLGGLAAWVIAAFAPVGGGTEGLLLRIGLAFVLAPIIAAAAGHIVQRFRPVENFIPITRFAKLGLIGAIDWGAMFGVFYLSGLALGVRIPVDDGIQTVFAGQLIGMISMMPGGMGSADAVWLRMLTSRGVETNMAAAHILLFRLVFYVLPWFVSLIGLYMQFSGQGDVVMRWQRRLLAGAIGLNAAVLLASSATPVREGRLEPVLQFVPAGVVEASHVAAVLAAAIMLFLIRGLLRGYRAAFLVTAAMLFASVISHLLKGLDYEEAIFSLAMFMLLVGTRRSFTRRGRVPIGWELTLAGALGTAGFFLLVGVTAFTAAPYAQEIWPELLEHPGVARFFRGLVVVGLVGAVFLMREALTPQRTHVQATPEEIRHSTAFLHAHAQHAGQLNVACGDKGVWLWRRTDERTRAPASPLEAMPDGLVVYQRRHRKMVVFGDPVVDDRHAADLVEELHLAAHDEDLVPVFYQISGRWMRHLHDFGYSFLKLGEEAIVPLEGFALESEAANGYRRIVQRLEAGGFAFNILHPPFTNAIIDEARRVSDAWLAHRGVQEMQFSVGHFSPAYLQRFPMAVVRDSAGRMAAFANILTARPRRRGAAADAHRGEVTFDLLRHLPDAEPLMDFIVINMMRWGADHNYAHLNLGVSPLRDVDEYRKASVPRRLARLLHEHGERIYGRRGGHAFKNKFRPVWEPRFIAYQRPWDWASTLVTTTSLIWARTPQDRKRIERATSV